MNPKDWIIYQPIDPGIDNRLRRDEQKGTTIPSGITLGNLEPLSPSTPPLPFKLQGGFGTGANADWAQVDSPQKRKGKRRFEAAKQLCDGVMTMPHLKASNPLLKFDYNTAV
ncbi:hypothetical protein CRENBAI_011973, partial [Crenichthys baileyi]